MEQKDRFRLQREHTICIVIDLQTQLMSAMEDRIISETEKNNELLIASLKILNVPIVVTEQYPRGLGPTSDPIKQALDNLYSPVEKVVFSCWDEPQFREKISTFKPGNFILTGLETHVCVLQTALDLLAEGYNVYIPADTTCSRYKS
ncbi:MAG: isochorismatase family protein, partial [Dehalococcoidia bacterium]